MTISLSSPVTGAAQTGLTSPTYTVVSDTAPTPEGKQWVVTALGGTQTGVTSSSVSSPFTITFFRPKAFSVARLVDAVTGILRNNPVNTWKVVVRKGTTPLAGQAAQTLVMTTSIGVPAGSDLNDPANVRASLSLAIGALSQVSAGLGDALVTGIMG